jgi:hypothetical protein
MLDSLSVYSGGHSVNVAFGAPLETFISSCGQECGAQEKESAVKRRQSHPLLRPGACIGGEWTLK